MAAIKYTFNDHIITCKNSDAANPQRWGEALDRIARDHDGQIEPVWVVDAAREPRHVLHTHFEWDNTVAAEAYRVDQARRIIRAVHIVSGDDEAPRAFLSINNEGETAYHTLRKVQSSVSLQEALMQAALRDLEAFERRYKQLEDVCVLVRKAKAALAKRRRGADKETRASA